MRGLIAFALVACAGCKPGGVGDPCVPEDEYSPSFGGFDETEVSVETRSFQCETRVCLVNHFRGRVSCPYGQTADDVASLPASDPARCRVPGTEEGVRVQVKPQLVQRAAAAYPHGGHGVRESVYCSCRCANADGRRNDGKKYCDCPSGYDCQHLIDDLGLGDKEVTGSYCVKADSRYYVADLECSAPTKNCGLDGNNP